MLKLLSFFLILICVNAFAQKKEGESEEQYKKRVLQELGVEDKTEKEVTHSVDLKQESEGPVEDKDLEASLDGTVKNFAGMGGMDEEGNTLEVSDKEDIKPVKIKDSFLSKMMSSEIKNLLGTMMVKSPFSDMKRETIETVFIAKNEGNPLGAFLKSNEKAKNILVDFLKDEKALPNIVGLVNKPEKVKTLSIFIGAVFVLVFILNLMNSKGGLFQRVFKKFLIILGGGIANFACIIYLFHDELSPTFNIVFKYFHL